MCAHSSQGQPCDVVVEDASLGGILDILHLPLPPVALPVGLGGLGVFLKPKP